jgi:hypothetical protein
MLHTQYFQRRISGIDPATDPRFCQKIPRCYCLRFQPAGTSDGPIAGMPSGKYPLTIHRSASGDVIHIYDSEVLYFNGGLKPGKGASLAAWVGTLGAGGIPDVWMMTWGDEPGDYIDPAPTGLVGGPVPVNGNIGLGMSTGNGSGNPVLIGGVKGTTTALMLEMLGNLNSGAARVARKGEVLFDSTLLPGGALLDSGLLDLQGVDAVEVHADNVAGAVFRDLSMEAYTEAGVLIETILLRKVAWGAAANGARYAPGKVRGLISENPPGGVTADFLLYDGTSAANTLLDTGSVVAEDMDSIRVSETPSGVPVPGTLTMYETDDAGVAVASQTGVTGNNSNPAVMGWGVGISVAVQNNYAGGIAAPVPRRVRVTQTAIGAGITSRIRISGRGRQPGTFAVQMAVPPKARFKLLAGGAADGRLVVVAR